jgi:hypothetical protein
MGGRGQKEKGGKEIEFMFIGLSYENLNRLKMGQPILCKASDFGCTGDIEIMIFAGETEQSMAREMHELIGKNTNVSIDPRLRD